MYMCFTHKFIFQPLVTWVQDPACLLSSPNVDTVALSKNKLGMAFRSRLKYLHKEHLDVR